MASKDNKSKVISMPGFISAKSLPKLRNRLVTAVSGAEKEGKTTFALSAPGPIALFNMDIGLEGVVDKWIDKKEILVTEFDYRDSTNQAEWVNMWETMKRNYLAALKNPEIRTVIFDTETEMWELCRMARFGKISAPGQNISYWYAPVNAEYRDLVRKIYDTDKNLVLLRKLKDEYVNDKKTGNMESAGFKDIPYLSQVDVVLWREREEVNPKLRGMRGGGGDFGFTVRECRQNPEIEGMDMKGDLSNFPTLASMVFPSTDAEDWE